MITCSRCGRNVTSPLYAGGMAFGSTCFRKVVGSVARVPAAVKAHAQAGARRRRAAAVVDSGRADAPAQMELELA